MNKIKLWISILIGWEFVFKLSHFIRRIIFTPNYIYAINYHSTPNSDRLSFEQQVEFYSKYFDNVSLTDLNMFFDNKKWHKKKPGLIISFDDGLRNNFDVALPILEKYGFTGWFFIPVDFLNAGSESQFEFSKSYNITTRGSNEYIDRRVAISWKELLEISNKHVIGSHTCSHHRMTECTDIDKAKREIFESKIILEKKLGKKVDSFCWVGGEEKSYSRLGAKLIEEAGYKYAFMTNSLPITVNSNWHQLQRNNIESDYKMPLVWFTLSGLMEIKYIFKRRRVNKVTNVTNKGVTS